MPREEPNEGKAPAETPYKPPSVVVMVHDHSNATLYVNDRPVEGLTAISWSGDIKVNEVNRSRVMFEFIGDVTVVNQPKG